MASFKAHPLSQARRRSLPLCGALSYRPYEWWQKSSYVSLFRYRFLMSSAFVQIMTEPTLVMESLGRLKWPTKFV